MEQGLIAIIITILIIASAVKTRKCVECMTAGSLIAAVFAYKSHFLTGWHGVLQKTMSDNMRYMATGNSIAVPCAERVFQGIVAAEQEIALLMAERGK